MRIVRALFLPLFLLARHGVDSGSTFAPISPLAVLQEIDYRFFLAGGSCAAISHGITTPIDVVKTKIQAEPQKYNKGMLKATTDILKEDGPGVLLGGLGPTVVGYGIEGAMKFGFYEVLKPVFADMMKNLSKSGDGNMAVAYLLASVVAGAIAAMLLCPMESTRIRIVTDPAYADKGLLTALPKMLKEDGIFSSFNGLWAMLAKQIPYTLGKQVSFDVFAGMLYAFFHSIQDSVQLAESQVKWAVSVVAAFFASLIACIFSQPGDMILTETYRTQKKAAVRPAVSRSTAAATGAVDSSRRGTAVATKSTVSRSSATDRRIRPATLGASNKSPATIAAKDDRSFVDVVQAIYAAGGLSNFFTGTGARIVHVGVIITSQLVIYDIVKQLLGLPATGSH